ncbi:DNA-3-methyladenine glycosylase [Rugosimonospora acidiphila]|uniref:DNA-3-methyladenine glycosylase n=1 Tax=Rugosimonospora acidiphila TaxID=556531 RepID=UPI0031EBA917
MGQRAGGTPLTRREPGLAELLAGPVDRAARGLLGCRLVAGGVTVRLTEVEAYSGTGLDPASHAHRGRTPRNAVMFGPAGYAYVYFTYGMHWCVNVVCGVEGEASAVLLRAGSIVDGLETARARRVAVRRDIDLARGPARLCATLGIDRAFYGTNLLDGSGLGLLLPRDGKVGEIEAGPRVGVTGAHDLPWRFWLKGDPTVSAYRRHVPRRAST